MSHSVQINTVLDVTILFVFEKHLHVDRDVVGAIKTGIAARSVP